MTQKPYNNTEITYAERERGREIDVESDRERETPRYTERQGET